MFWQRAMHDHCISKNNHMNESPDCNSDYHTNQNSLNEMEHNSLYSKAPCSLDSSFSLCRPFLDFSVSREQFSGNLFFTIFRPDLIASKDFLWSSKPFFNLIPFYVLICLFPFSSFPVYISLDMRCSRVELLWMEEFHKQCLYNGKISLLTSKSPTKVPPCHKM